MAVIHFNQAATKRIAAILLGLAIFSLPFGLGPLSNLFLLALALLCFVAMNKSDWAYSLRSPITWTSWTFFFIYAISLSYSEDLQSGLKDLETKLSFLLGPPVLVAVGRYFKEAEKRKFKDFFIIGCAISLLAALVYAGWRSINSQSFSYVKINGSQEHFFFLYETLSEPFMHPGYLSTLYGFAILFLVNRVWKPKKEERKLINWFLMIWLALGLFLLQGRINILALAIILGSMIFIRIISQKRWLLMIGGTASFGLLILLFISFAPQALKERYLAFPDFSYELTDTNFNSATYRLAEWECALVSLKESPWIGYGIGDAKEELLDTYKEKGFLEGWERRYNAHNQYLETSMAAGLLGLIALVALLFAYIQRAHRLNKTDLLTALLFFALCLCTESMFERAWAIVSFNVLFPFLLSSTKSD